jgi:Putative Actinobacterial Holin-X, holin superfamily III
VIVFKRNGNGPPAGSTAEAARQVVLHVRKIVGLEAELAGIELRQKAKAGATGIGTGAAAAYLALVGALFLLGAVAAALATVMPVWAALLIVAGLLFAGAVIAALIARRVLKTIPPALPDQTIDEARRTVAAVRS